MKTITMTAAALLAVGITAASGIGHVAQAQINDVRTIAVHHGDLDLNSSAGRTALEARIRHAVRAACGSASPADLEGQNQVAECRRDLNASLQDERDAAFAAAGRNGAPTVLVARR